MQMIEKLVIASNNAGKLREIGQILAPLRIEVVPQSQFQVPEAEEPFETFVENALAKARHAARHTGLPALADDSGICVAALGGAPGVHSARFAGEPRSDQRNNDRLLELLAPQADRRAHYYCVMVLMRHAADPQPMIAQAEWHGEILRAPRGAGGFGYDPLFLDPALGRTGAELDPEHKNRISHRGRALAELARQLGRQA
jgi:XTP/dITP diphosphohydrolase